jgi:hypothetical protein
LLPLSEQTIVFNQSSDYRRCIIVVYLFAAIALVYSSLPWLISIPLTVLLIIRMQQALLAKSASQKLVGYPDHWLFYNEQEILKYKEISIKFNGGFFTLLQLKGFNPKKTLLIFNDQITLAQHRLLKFKEKAIRKEQRL